MSSQSWGGWRVLIPGCRMRALFPCQHSGSLKPGSVALMPAQGLKQADATISNLSAPPASVIINSNQFGLKLPFCTQQSEKDNSTATEGTAFSPLPGQLTGSQQHGTGSSSNPLSNSILDSSENTTPACKNICWFGDTRSWISSPEQKSQHLRAGFPLPSWRGEDGFCL